MFIRGDVYKRSELHHSWGGTVQLQTQGGILTPLEAPLVILVSGGRGKRHGYDDHWDDEGIFHYYGAGPGDMVFLRGNKAVRDHVANGESIHLFIEASGGLRYWGQLLYAGYDEIDGAIDVNGKERRAIVFRLIPTDDGNLPAPPPPPESAEGDKRWDMSIEELANRLMVNDEGSATTAADARRRIYRRSSDLKIFVRRRAAGLCEGCGASAPFLDRKGHPYLEPHHTTRVADGGPDSPDHVIALCPSCHRRVHSGEDGAAYNEALRHKLASIAGSPG